MPNDDPMMEKSSHWVSTFCIEPYFHQVVQLGSSYGAHFVAFPWTKTGTDPQIPDPYHSTFWYLFVGVLEILIFMKNWIFNPSFLSLNINFTEPYWTICFSLLVTHIFWMLLTFNDKKETLNIRFFIKNGTFITNIIPSDPSRWS